MRRDGQRDETNGGNQIHEDEEQKMSHKNTPAATETTKHTHDCSAYIH